MDAVKKFSTKTGYCHVLPDKIILSKQEELKELSQIRDHNKIIGILIAYGVIALGLVLIAYEYYKTGNVFSPTVFGLLALFLIFGIIMSINNSTTPLIERDSIKAVHFKKGVPGFTRDRFEVKFANKKGRIKKRLIILSTSTSHERENVDLAKKILKEENLLT